VFGLKPQLSIAQTVEGTASPEAATASPVPTSSASPVTFAWRTDGGANKLGRPSSVVTDSQGNVYVVDGNHDRIQKFDANGNSLALWGSSGNGDGQFMFRAGASHPDGMTIDTHDVLYVVDYSGRVQKFDTNGKFLGLWGAVHSIDNPKILNVSSMAIDHRGNLYIADSDNTEPPKARLQEFDSAGHLLTTWDANFMPSWQDDFLSVAVDGQDDLYVAGGQSNHIWKLDSTGKLLTTWGNTGSNNGQFHGAQGIAIDKQANVYVGDNQGNRIEKFDSDGRFLGQWGSQGSGDGQFDYVFKLAVDKDGNVYVTSDGGYDRLQKFIPIT